MESKQTFSDLIDLARERTSVLLFKNFSFRRWVTFLFIAWMAGAMGGGSNLQLPSGRGEDKQTSKQTESAQPVAESNSSVPESQNGSDLGSDSKGAPAVKENPNFDFKSPLFIGAAAVFGLIFIAVVFLMAWLRARFQFIFLHSVLTQSTEIVAPFKHFKKQGNSYFWFGILVGLASLVIVILEIVPLIIFAVRNQPFEWLAFIKFAWPFILLLLVTILLLTIVSVLTDDFMIPAMAVRESSHWKEGWREAYETALSLGGRFWTYLAVKIGLGILCGILVILMALAVILAALIAGFGIYFLFLLMQKIHAVLVLLPVLLGVAAGAVSLFLLFSVGLPFAIFFRSFSYLVYQSSRADSVGFSD